ncbi:MAG TPA: hypothetical protein VII51_12160 [Gaiellaceae bacterium]
MDWTVVSALATGGGTLVLAGRHLASVRSANRAARVAEQSLLAGIRPLLIPISTAPLHARRATAGAAPDPPAARA